MLNCICIIRRAGGNAGYCALSSVLRSATEKKRLYRTVYHAKIYVDRVGLRLFAGLTDSKRGYGMGRRMVGLHAVFLASALMLGGCGTGNKVVNF